MTTVYGPCLDPLRTEFLDWFKNLDVKDEDNWIIMGDFNFYRSLEDRNMPGGDFMDTFRFQLDIWD